MPITIETTPEQDATYVALIDTFPDADFWIDPVTTTDEGTIYVRLTQGDTILDRAIYASGLMDAHNEDPDDLEENFERITDEDGVPSWRVLSRDADVVLHRIRRDLPDDHRLAAYRGEVGYLEANIAENPRSQKFDHEFVFENIPGIFVFVNDADVEPYLNVKETRS